MDGYTKVVFSTSRWIAVSIFLTSVGVPADGIDPQDATLFGVDFIDRFEGWAVGEQGVIWHTLDAGKTFDLQRIPTTATLRAVRMEAPWTGLIGARESVPFGRGSIGHIFRTTNGGNHWQTTTPRPLLGGVSHIHIDDAGVGVALGESSDVHPSGISLTSDAGKSWIPLRNPMDLGWTAHLSLDADHVLLATPKGHILLLHQGDVQKDLDLQLPAGGAVRAFAKGQGRIWAATDRCRLYVSSDAGMNWKRCTLPVSDEAARNWDLTALAAVGSHVWAAGRPGSVVLHSADAGATWSVERTGSTAPLFALDFTDENDGWAVGAMGTILATTDSGKSWIVRKQGDDRATALWIEATPSMQPFASASRWGSTEGYRVVATSLARESVDAPSAGDASLGLRYGEAFRHAGGTYAELRPYSATPALAPLPTTSPREKWPSSDDITREIVLAIRLWQPRVVVGSNHVIAGQLLGTPLERAFEWASRSDVFPEQISVLGLSAATPVNLLTVSDEKSDTSIDLAQVGGEPSWSAVARTESAIGRFTIAPSAVPLRTNLTFLKTPAQRRDDWLAGVEPIAPASPGRRQLSVVPPREIDDDLWSAWSQRDENLSNEAWHAKIRLWVVGKEPAVAGWMLFDLARRLAADQRVDEAKRVLDFLVVHQPQDPFADAAYRILIALHESQEIRGSDPIPAGDPALRRALAYARKLQQDGHRLNHDPLHMMTVISAARRSKQEVIANAYFQWAQVSSLMGQRIARLEDPQRMLDGSIADATLSVRRSTRSPVIDGDPSETTKGDWTTLVADGSASLDICFQHDVDHLYIAARCRQASSLAESLSPDRLVLWLDVDRDAATALVVEGDRVRLTAPLLHPAALRPAQWAHRDVNDGWTAEWAVPWSSLAGTPTASPWAFALRVRTGPSDPVESQQVIVPQLLMKFENHESRSSETLRAN